MNTQTFICISNTINYPLKAADKNKAIIELANINSDIRKKTLKEKSKINEIINKYDMRESQNDYLIDKLIEIIRIIDSNHELREMFEEDYFNYRK